MDQKTETKQLRLRDHPFLKRLVDEGMVWSQCGLDRVINVIAVAGQYDDWTAYFETPESGPWNVRDLGSKLPERVAAEIFPEWAKNREWRP